MTNIDKLLEPADYEIRAARFSEAVERAGLIIEKKYRRDFFNLAVENALQKWADQYEALQRLFETLPGELPAGLMSPAMLAHDLDRQSGSQAIIAVYALSDSSPAMREFIARLREKASEFGGTIDKEFSLSTGDEANLFHRIDSPGESMLAAHLFFRFE